jgi:hypothetical protein
MKKPWRPDSNTPDNEWPIGMRPDGTLNIVKPGEEPPPIMVILPDGTLIRADKIPPGFYKWSAEEQELWFENEEDERLFGEHTNEST